MIIGLTGRNASGKGEAAAYLEKKGFTYFSLSDELRVAAKEKEIEPVRENLIKLGNELRVRFGANYLAKRINDKIKDEGNFAIDSIRNLEEIKELRKNKDFVLLGIDAPVELRFKRSRERGRAGDAETLEQFKELEEKENLKNKTSQQLDECFNSADKVIINEDSLEDLHKKIDQVIKT
ncbi:AAA family ATPase [Candidatus Woesearchaeota archaeon]|nr:AAA family ATPase [Candidatus Woesearchaeota archaeon]